MRRWLLYLAVVPVVLSLAALWVYIRFALARATPGPAPGVHRPGPAAPAAPFAAAQSADSDDGPSSSDDAPSPAPAPPEALVAAPFGPATRYLFFRPRLAGFNNQLQEVIATIALALRVGQGVVLPLLAESVTWTHYSMDRLFPYGDYFDVAAMAALLPVISTAEWQARCHGTLRLDLTHRSCAGKNKRALTNPEYDQRLRIAVNTSRTVNNWKALAEGPPAGEAPLPECVGVNWPLCFSKPLLRQRSKVTDPSLKATLVDRNPVFRLIWSRLIPAPHLLALAENVTAPLGTFVAIHVRVGDFRKWCGVAPQTARWKCPSDAVIVRETAAVARLHRTSTVFVACDPDFLAGVLASLARQAEAAGEAALRFVSFPAWFPALRPDVKSLVEQTVCARAAAFIGNSFSTWSVSTHYTRRVRGLPCNATYMWARDPGVMCAAA